VVYDDANIRDFKTPCDVRTAVVSAASRWHKSGLLLRRLGCDPPGAGGGQPHSYRSGPAQEAATDITTRTKNITF
jgi:hypothetical protein